MLSAGLRPNKMVTLCNGGIKYGKYLQGQGNCRSQEHQPNMHSTVILSTWKAKAVSLDDSSL